jgi:hypothetical protein
MPKETLSASKIKTLKSCSWLYWAKYHLKLPDKTNEGALKGEIVHLIFECLGEDKHKAHYDTILKKKNAFASKSVKRLILKHVRAKNINTEEAIEDIKEMVYKGLLYDFFGTKYGAPSQVISEKEFEILVTEEDISYKIKGFIDKLFIYNDKGIVLIRDFKTNKKKYEGKEITDNLQDNMYTLAVKRLYPELQNIKMEFLFLKQDTESEILMQMEAKTKHEIVGFEHELTEYQKYADSFTEKTAYNYLAAKQGIPKDKSFGGKLLCGFATKPNEKKKDGTSKWYCTYKFPFQYFSLYNEKNELVKNAFDKKDLQKLTKPNYKIEEKTYQGCPCWNSQEKEEAPQSDDFDLDKF